LPPVFKLFTQVRPWETVSACFESLVPPLKVKAMAVKTLTQFISDTAVNMIPKEFVRYCLPTARVQIKLRPHTEYLDSLASKYVMPEQWMRVCAKIKQADPDVQKVVTICHLASHFITASVCLGTNRLTIIDGCGKAGIQNWEGVERRYKAVAMLTKCLFATFRPTVNPVRIRLRCCMGGQASRSVDCGPLAIMHATAELTSQHGTVGIRTNTVSMQTVRNSIVCMMAAVQYLNRHVDYLPTTYLNRVGTCTNNIPRG
jgi:hypothetical protein